MNQSFIHWFTPHMAATAMPGPDQSQKPGTSSRSSQWVAGVHLLVPSTAAFPSTSSRELDQKQGRQDSDWNSDTACEQHKQLLNPLSHSADPQEHILKIWSDFNFILRQLPPSAAQTLCTSQSTGVFRWLLLQNIPTGAGVFLVVKMPLGHPHTILECLGLSPSSTLDPVSLNHSCQLAANMYPVKLQVMA